MTLQDRQSLSPTVTSDDSASPWLERALVRLAPRIEFGQLSVETPGGRRLAFKGPERGPQAQLKFHSWRCLARIAAQWDTGFADAYSAGELSSPDMTSVLRFAMANRHAGDRVSRFRPPSLGSKIRHALNRNTRNGSRRNISAHYDLGNEFYRPWLDKGMTYSSALFSSPDQSLEDAQEAKLDRVIELLNLRGGESVLEIGCGWGSLAERLLEQHDCTVTGVTLSEQQLEFARNRLGHHVTSGRADLRLEDYRDIDGRFDRVVSIEMLEAVGVAYWPRYFETLRNCLKPGGEAVLQVITIEASRFASYRRSPDFIQQRIFPGGMLPTADIVRTEAANAGLTPSGSELFGASYARTLEVWRHRFQQAWPSIRLLGFDERFRRLWEYYLGYCQVGFEASAIDVGLYRFRYIGRD